MTRKIYALVLLIACCSIARAQHNGQHRWGIGLDLLGPTIEYPTVGIDGWVQLDDHFWINGEAGYGGRPDYYESDPFYGGSAWRYHVSAQLFYDAVSKPYFSWFVGTGPHWMEVGDELGRGFVYNMPEGALTAHSGADFRLTRFGLLSTTGVRFILGRITLGTRVHIPVYYARTSFSNLQDPILVVDYMPVRIRNDQEKISGIRMSSGLSFHFGLALGRREK